MHIPHLFKDPKAQTLLEDLENVYQLSNTLQLKHFAAVTNIMMAVAALPTDETRIKVIQVFMKHIEALNNEVLPLLARKIDNIVEKKASE